MDLELALLVILAAVVLLLIAAQLLRVPYPILLVIGGLGLGFVPGLSDVQLDPDLVLVIMLPPLLYASAFFTPLRELRRNVRPISLLAVLLVLTTVVTVAWVAHEWLGFDWPAAFVLGAVVSPTDPIAASAIARRVGIPARLVTILEGESLINDATALVTYKFAVAAVLTGGFSLGAAVGDFFVNVAGGVAIGVAVGFCVAAIRRRLDNPPVEVTIALFTAYFAYLPAEEIGVSGVVAAVTVGIYMGRQTSQLTNATTRIQGDAVWEIVTFILNSALFILVGMQLQQVTGDINAPTSELIGDGALIAGAVILTRIVWVYPFTYLPRWAFKSIRARDPYPPLSHPTVIAWTGMRGAVSLAAALALPFQTDAGAAFPHRDLIVFLTFSVILGTLLLQGLTLAPLIRLLGLDDRDEALEREESKARMKTAEAAIERIDQVADEPWVRDLTAERMRARYDYRLRRFRSRFSDSDGDSEEFEDRASDYTRLLGEILDAQRGKLAELRNQGKINDEVLRRIERELDYEDSRRET